MEIRRGEVSKLPGHVFVPRGDPALTRALLARGAHRVISKRRGRREQIGVAATKQAIEAARLEVEATSEQRALTRERSRVRRAAQEDQYRADFEAELRRLFPGMPDADRDKIVRHTCEVSSGRVGRSSRAKALAVEPIQLAVRAHIRHEHTDYDARLRRAGFGQRFGRADKDARKAARKAVKKSIDRIFASWQRPTPAAGSEGGAGSDTGAGPEAGMNPGPGPEAGSGAEHRAGTGTGAANTAARSPITATVGEQLRLWQRPLG